MWFYWNKSVMCWCCRIFLLVKIFMWATRIYLKETKLGSVCNSLQSLLPILQGLPAKADGLIQWGCPVINKLVDMWSAWSQEAVNGTDFTCLSDTHQSSLISRYQSSVSRAGMQALCFLNHWCFRYRILLSPQPPIVLGLNTGHYNLVLATCPLCTFLKVLLVSTYNAAISLVLCRTTIHHHPTHFNHRFLSCLTTFTTFVIYIPAWTNYYITRNDSSFGAPKLIIS